MNFISIIFYNYIITNFAVSFTAYDCKGPRDGLLSYSLIDVGECKKFPPTTNEVKTEIQLIQVTNYKKLSVIACRINIMRTISGCGMASHTYNVKNAMADYVIDVNQKDCELMVNKGYYLLNNNIHINNIPVNTTITKSVILTGSVDSDGKCSGSTHLDQFGSWENVVVQAIVSLKTSVYDATVNNNLNLLQTKSGYTCRLSDNTCYDDTDGNTYWSTPIVDPCKKDKYNLLHKGTAIKSIPTNENNSTLMMPLYTVSSSEVSYALLTTHTLNICGYKIKATEHPSLFIVDLQENSEKYLDNKNLNSQSLDPSIYFNSKLVYLEKHLRSQITNLYDTIRFEKCMLEQNILTQGQILASISPDEFALSYLKKTGYMAYISGEVIYFFQCVKLNVIVAHVDKCYSELPINVSGTIKYMRPRTRIIKDYGTEIDCNIITPPQYKIDDNWISLNPLPNVVKEPLIMSPDNIKRWKYNDLTNLARSGIYTEEQLESIRETYLFPINKISVQDNMVQRALGKNLNSMSFNYDKLITPDTIRKYTTNLFNWSWRWLNNFGTFIASIIGIITIMQMIKYMLNVIFHLFTLYSLYGLSYKLCAALLSSLTTLFVTKKHSEFFKKHQLVNSKDKPINNLETNIDEIENVTPTEQNEIIRLEHHNYLAQPSASYCDQNSRLLANNQHNIV